jgi:hypothetical protein
MHSRLSAPALTAMTTNIPFQRVGAISNAQVGADFEARALSYFAGVGIHLQPAYRVLLGVGDLKKSHAFDLGCADQKIIVECKSHRWTAGSNVPSAKLTVWNEAMYYFHLAPADYRKIMFFLRDPCARRAMTLGRYYLSAYAHLVPSGVEFWEYDLESETAEQLR